MFKKRNISVYNDLKTGFFCRLLLFLGVILLVFYILENLFFLFRINENLLGILLAFAILLLGVGFILYFLSCQFAKLACIAKDIEKENLTEDNEKSK